VEKNERSLNRKLVRIYWIQATKINGRIKNNNLFTKIFYRDGRKYFFSSKHVPVCIYFFAMKPLMALHSVGLGELKNPFFICIV